MIAFNPPSKGQCLIDVTHVRPFDKNLVEQGHPICFVSSTGYAYPIRSLRMMDEKNVAFDVFSPQRFAWYAVSSCRFDDLANSGKYCLAPLAVKDGRPLHVGDEISVFREEWLGGSDRVKLSFDFWQEKLALSSFWQWRWPD